MVKGRQKGLGLEDQLGQWRRWLDWENNSPKDRPEPRRPAREEGDWHGAKTIIVMACMGWQDVAVAIVEEWLAGTKVAAPVAQ